MEMEMEKIPNANPDIGSELPPSYPGSTAYQTPVIPEPVSYPATTSTFASELPPSYLSSSSAISQPKGTTQHTTVAVVTSQPSRVTRSSTTSGNIRGAADTILAISVCWCVACFICGSPLTISCFVPAIVLAILGSQYASNGEPDRAKKAICTSRVLTIIGIMSGIAVVVIIIILEISSQQ